MVIKESVGMKIFRVLNGIVLSFVCVVTLYPLLFVLFASFSNGNDLLRHTGVLLHPLNPTVAAYKMVFNDPMIIKGYGNTVFVVVFGVTVNVILSVIGAFFLSRKQVLLRPLIALMIMFTMVFKGGIVPLYFTVQTLGLKDNLLALILPSAINTFNLIILRTAFVNIPMSLEEAAKLDGAGNFKILWMVMFPLVLPTVAVIVLYYAVERWNAWYHAMLFITDRQKYPLQLVLRGILLQNNDDAMAIGVSVNDREMASETIKYAVIIVATLPILVLYPFLQKFFVKGVMVGAVKG